MGDLQDLQDLISDRLRQVNVALPGRVESYDSATRKASVLPLIDETYGDGTVVRFKPITNVPVVMPATASARITMPISVGDIVLIVFSQRSLDLWLSEGGITKAGDVRMHAMSDAIAIPGLFPFNGVPSSGVNLELTSALINAGAGGTLQALLNEAAATLYNSHTHGPGTYVAGPDPVLGASATPTQQMGTPEKTAVLKAE
jgi:hypothetical protein